MRKSSTQNAPTAASAYAADAVVDYTEQSESAGASGFVQAAPAKPALMSERISTILWMPVDGLGDIVLGMPALHALSAAFPDARVDVVAREAYASFFQHLPFVRNVIQFEPPGLPVRTQRSAGIWDMVRLYAQLRSRRYDLAVDLGGKNLYRRIAFFSGARLRVGPAVSHYDKPGQKNWASLLTHPVPPAQGKCHTGDKGLHLMRHLGIDTEHIKFFPSDTDPAEATVLRKLTDLGVGRTYVILHGASAVNGKQWAPRRFAALANHIIDNFGHDIVLTGVKKDRLYNTLVTHGVQRKDKVFDTAGQFNLSELPSLYRRARLMVTIDTGPMHIADAVGTPMVSLFLPGEVHLFHPYHQPESVILSRGSQFAATFAEDGTSPILAQEAAELGRQMKEIMIEQVITAVDARLQQPGCQDDTEGEMRSSRAAGTSRHET